MSDSERHAIDTAMLAELGRLAPSDRQDELRERCTEDGLLAAVLDGSGRCFPYDPEDVSGEAVTRFLKEVARPMAILGAKVDSVAEGDEDDEVGLTVIVDSVPEIIAAPGEEGDERERLATERTFDLVNRRLAAAGSPERLYALEREDGVRAILLTERLAEAIGDEFDEPKERPYVPTAEHDEDG